MRLVILLSLTIFISNVTGLLIYLFQLHFSHHEELFLGQTTEAPNYSCSVNDSNVKFTLSSSSHSAWEPTTNCFLSQCNVNSSSNDSCRSSSTPCFDYRTVNNISISAPAISCSILEPCNDITNQCISTSSVCVINSCCSPSAVCLPRSWTSFCTSGNDISKSIFIN